MKNKKAILILSVLILLFLIGSVSANDVNTTDVSASDTDDVTGAVTVDSTDENYANDLTDKPKDLDDLKILNVSSDDDYTNGNNVENNLKEKYGNSNNDFNNDVLSSSNYEILSASGVTVSYGTFRFTDTIFNITIYDLSSTSFKIKIDTEPIFGAMKNITVYNPPLSYQFPDGSYLMDSFYSGTGAGYFSTFSTGSMRAGTSNTFTIPLTSLPNVLGIRLAVETQSSGGRYILVVMAPPIKPTVSFDNDLEITYNPSGTYSISGKVKSDSTNVNEGTITLKQGSTTLGNSPVSVSSGKWTVGNIPYNKFSPGTYELTAEYTGSGAYASTSASKTLTVNKMNPSINVGSQSIYYGQDTMPTFSGTVSSTSGDYYEGTVDLYINNQLVASGISVSKAGSWSYTLTALPDLNPGSYNVKIDYSGSTYVNSKTETKTSIYTVNKNTPDISAGQNSISYGQSNDVIISGLIRNPNVSNVYTGTANITIGNRTWNNVVVNNDGSWTVPGFSSILYAPDTYVIGVSYSGNNYTMAKTVENSGTLTVNKGMLFVMVTNTGNIDFGGSEIVSVTVMNYARMPIGNISVKLMGDGIQDYLINTTNSEGKLTFNVPGLIRGQYNNWELEITGNEYYEDYPFQYPVNPFNVQSPLNVLITGISPNNSTFPEKIIITGYTDADSIPQGNVSIIIGSKTYTGFFDSTGNFTASLMGVKPGTYDNITVKYNPTVDEFYYRGVESTVSIQETGMVIC